MQPIKPIPSRLRLMVMFTASVICGFWIFHNLSPDDGILYFVDIVLLIGLVVVASALSALVFFHDTMERRYREAARRIREREDKRK